MTCIRYRGISSVVNLDLGCAIAAPGGSPDASAGGAVLGDHTVAGEQIVEERGAARPLAVA